MVSHESQPPGAVCKGRTILLVEDDKIARDLVRTMLLQLGAARVDEAEDGSQALRKLDVQRY